MLLVSKGFKTAILGPHAFTDIFGGGQLRLFAGARPSRADMAEPSTPIAVVTRVGSSSNGLRFVQSNDFVVKHPTDDWRLKVLRPGKVIWWRLIAAGDTYEDSPTAPRIDGDAGALGTPADMMLATTTFEGGEQLRFDSFVYTLPPLTT